MASIKGSRDSIKAGELIQSFVPSGQRWQLIQADGAGPFVSRMIHRRMDGKLHIWSSRSHRKLGGLRLGVKTTEEQNRPGLKLWSPSELGWWISSLFMIGSACIALGSFTGLAPNLFAAIFLQATVVNAVFFTGSLFFTSAAYLQLLEAANADRRAALARGVIPSKPFSWFGWLPGQIGWLSAAIQFAGTLMFNINTADAMLPGLGWLQQDLLIWTPDVVGCVCFLIGAYMLLPEMARHRNMARQPGTT